MQRFRHSWLRLAWLLVLAPLALGQAPGDIGTWDPRGGYTPSRRRTLHARLHESSRADAGRPRYPVVLVHGIIGWSRARKGVFYFDYYNGVRRELRRLGVPLLVTETTNFASVEERATALRSQILPWMDANGFEKVNLVAHSMGGIDCRYLVSRLDMAPRVASLTTVSSPHHGSWFADFVVENLFVSRRFLEFWEKRLGLRYEAIPQMSVRHMNQEFNPRTPDAPGVRYFSFSGRASPLTMPPPLNAMALVNSVMEKRLAGKRRSLSQRVLGRVLLPKRMRKALERGSLASLQGRDDWVLPGLVGRNDGIIPTSSGHWGEHLVTLEADHFDQLGWFGTFRAPRFYRNICRMLADAGL